jgi:hypothetical protein
MGVMGAKKGGFSGIRRISVVELAFRLGHVAGGNDPGGFPVGPESKEQISVGDGPAEGVKPCRTVAALGIRQKSYGEGVFKRFLQLAGLDAPEVELHVDEVEFHSRSVGKLRKSAIPGFAQHQE